MCWFFYFQGRRHNHTHTQAPCWNPGLWLKTNNQAHTQLEIKLPIITTTNVFFPTWKLGCVSVLCLNVNGNKPRKRLGLKKLQIRRDRQLQSVQLSPRYMAAIYSSSIKKQRCLTHEYQEEAKGGENEKQVRNSFRLIKCHSLYFYFIFSFSRNGCKKKPSRGCCVFNYHWDFLLVSSQLSHCYNISLTPARYNCGRSIRFAGFTTRYTIIIELLLNKQIIYHDYIRFCVL